MPSVRGELPLHLESQGRSGDKWRLVEGLLWFLAGVLSSHCSSFTQQWPTDSCHVPGHYLCPLSSQSFRWSLLLEKLTSQKGKEVDVGSMLWLVTVETLLDCSDIEPKIPSFHSLSHLEVGKEKLSQATADLCHWGPLCHYLISLGWLKLMLILLSPNS